MDKKILKQASPSAIWPHETYFRIDLKIIITRVHSYWRSYNILTPGKVSCHSFIRIVRVIIKCITLVFPSSSVTYWKPHRKEICLSGGKSAQAAAGSVLCSSKRCIVASLGATRCFNNRSPSVRPPYILHHASGLLPPNPSAPHSLDDGALCTTIFSIKMDIRAGLICWAAYSSFFGTY